MHELSIADSILDTVRQEAQKHPGAHVTKVGVRIGALSGVEPEALSFGFSALVQGTDLEPLALEIEAVPRSQRCPACDLTFDVTDEKIEIQGSGGRPSNSGGLDLGLRTPDYGPSLACPRCGLIETQLAGGEELDMAYFEIEEQ
jgi:hydrogenase nickel incorporation protein HypA/HybF